MNTSRRLAVPLLCCLAACGGAEQATPRPATPAPTPAAQPTAASEQEAKEMFQSLCSTCHGLTGNGDGPGSAAINPKPRSFADATWQASVTDEHIQKVIVYGGAAVGKSPFMVANPQLKGKTDVLAALTKIVRSYRK